MQNIIAPQSAALFKLSPAMFSKTCFLVFSLFLVPLAVQADTLEHALNQKYKKQILALRKPFTQGAQKFDSAGEPVDAPSNNGWVAHGAIYVKTLSLSSDTLFLQGPQIAFTGAEKNGKPEMVALSKNEKKIEIHLDQPLQSLDEAQAVLARVFFMEADAREHMWPEYRRTDPPAPEGQVYKVGKVGKVDNGESADKDVVQAPRPIYYPEPAFSLEAGSFGRFHGIVVLNITLDKQGNVSRIRIQKALGQGLDENAVESMKTWRFKPAMKDGQPVSVAMNVEVGFDRH